MPGQAEEAWVALTGATLGHERRSTAVEGLCLEVKRGLIILFVSAAATLFVWGAPAQDEAGLAPPHALALISVSAPSRAKLQQMGFSILEIRDDALFIAVPQNSLLKARPHYCNPRCLN